jgi:hypothetical protein
LKAEIDFVCHLFPDSAGRMASFSEIMRRADDGWGGFCQRNGEKIKFIREKIEIHKRIFSRDALKTQAFRMKAHGKSRKF